MPFPAQARQTGLVGFLDLNSGGEAPGILADALAGIIDVSDFVKLGKRERVLQAGVAAGTSAGSFAFATNMTVPNNEAWFIEQMTITATIPLGLTAQMCCAAQLPVAGGNQSYAIGPPVHNVSNAIASVMIARSERRILVPPGTIMGGVTLSLSAATAVSANGVLDFVRLRL